SGCHFLWLLSCPLRLLHSYDERQWCKSTGRGTIYVEPEFRFRLGTIRNQDSVCQMTSVTEINPPSIGPLVDTERTLRADARRNREAVVAAAKKLFADQGLDAQMPDVAKAAKVGVGTVYRHFPTKDDLIAAMAAERFERLAEKAQEGIEAGDPWEGLCDFIRFSAQIQADDRGLCEVM